MKMGTPGFVGERLREGREARGLSAITLAELSGVTRSAIAYYENGTNSPQLEVIDRIARVLNLPIAFFIRPVANELHSPVFYRSLSSATKAARLRGARRLAWLEQIVAYLSQLVLFPKPNFPDVGAGRSWSALAESDIEHLAIQVRRYWGLGDGPISNITLLMENNGAFVTRIEVDARTLDAFSTWSSSQEGIPFIATASDKHAAARSRLDIAHELGHMILHRGLPRTVISEPANFRLIEHQAQLFGCAFLAPATSFPIDFVSPNLDALPTLKLKWRISVGMMIHRASDLGLFSTDQAKRLWISYNRRGWRSREPLDDSLPIEEPKLVRRAFEVVIERRVRSREDVLARLSLSRQDVEELAGLPYGYLDDESPYVEATKILGGR